MSSSPSPRQAQHEIDGEGPKCSCGHGKGHIFVSVEKGYSGVGWFLLICGISAQVTRLSWRCRKCLEVLDSTEDAAQIAHHGRY